MGSVHLGGFDMPAMILMRLDCDCDESPPISPSTSLVVFLGQAFAQPCAETSSGSRKAVWSANPDGGRIGVLD
jgi:hypothetical protein